MDVTFGDDVFGFVIGKMALALHALSVRWSMYVCMYALSNLISSINLPSCRQAVRAAEPRKKKYKKIKKALSISASIAISVVVQTRPKVTSS